MVLSALILIPSLAKSAESASSREYKIKAALLFNFLKFVDWPKQAAPDDNPYIVIGIIGTDQFGDSFKPIEGAAIKNKKLMIKRFSKIEEIGFCHLLFISASERKNIDRILKRLEGKNVLTVSETGGFLELGGMINLIVEENKVNFEINLAPAEKAGLEITSKLLRLAKKVEK